VIENSKEKPMRAFHGAALAASLVGVTLCASAARADRPVISHYPVSGSVVVTDLCSFPITVVESIDVTETDFVNSSGAITRLLAHVVEQDTFSANGKTLIGEPYTTNLDVRFDSSGNVTQAYFEGVIEKVPLPDGSLFITSGRVDFVARGNPPFVLTPDVGATVNLAGFCAALSP
jgi:hypothetical protein